MHIIFLLFLFVIGACFGSFVCCQVRRMRMKEEGKNRKLGKRSVCLSCNKQLSWYDNVPIVSWLVLGGKCRKCKKKIGLLEFASELLMGLAFLFVGFSFGDFFTFTVIDWIYFVLVLCLVTVLGFLAIYDGKWGELPQRELAVAVIFGGAIFIVSQIKELVFNGTNSFFMGNIVSMFCGVGILAGTYFLLSFLSKEKLVGGGDWILGLAISLCLGNWWLSLVVLSLSNVLASVIMVPIVKKKKNKKIYFGPWMILAFLIVFIFRQFFLGFGGL